MLVMGMVYAGHMVAVSRQRTNGNGFICLAHARSATNRKHDIHCCVF